MNNGFSNGLIWIQCVLFTFFAKKDTIKGSIIDIIISSKKRDSLSLLSDQTCALHAFDPDHDSCESDFLELITISIILFFWCNVHLNITLMYNGESVKDPGLAFI